jgi:hypothetical protein
MTQEDLRRLRSYYHALLGHERTLAAIPSTNVTEVVDEGLYRVIETEVQEINTAFPGILPPFRHENFFSHDVGRGKWYRLHALRVYVGAAAGRLKGAIEDTDSAPVTQQRAFAYVNDAAVRTIIIRDYDELQRAYVAKCWKAVILLCGGSIEAILLDLLKGNEPTAKGAAAAPKQADLTRWDLSDLINVAVELKLVGAGIEKLSHSVRGYRNLIHPGVELRNQLSFDHEEARIALEVLHLLDRELSS